MFIPRYFLSEYRLGDLYEVAESMLKKRVVEENPSQEDFAFPDESFATSYPLLYQYLVSLAYPNGEARVTSTLTLFCDHGSLRGCLNDRDNGLSLFLTATGLMDLLDSFEAALGDDKSDWRASSKGPSSPAQKKRGSR